MQAEADKFEDSDLKFEQEAQSGASQTGLFRGRGGGSSVAKGPCSTHRLWVQYPFQGSTLERKYLPVSWFSMKTGLWYFTVTER